MKIIITFAMSHTWLWPQTCLTQLKKFNPGVEDCQIIVVDNAWDWSPAARGLGLFDVTVVNNQRQSKWHGTALDYIIDTFDADYLFTMESDVMVLRDGWLKWYLDKIQGVSEEGEAACYAVGHWHGEAFINPSATLYDMNVLKQAQAAFRANKDPMMYWGEDFQKSESIIPHYDKFLEDVGAFSEKRGFPPGTKMKCGNPTGQLRGPGWYEPAQQLHHWAVENGYGFIVANTIHEIDSERQIPIGTFYTDSTIEEANTVHLWGGTRALDILKHPVSDPTVLNNFEYWLEREARYWKMVVDPKIQAETIELIKKHGWYNRDMTERGAQAVRQIHAAYAKGGVSI